MDRLISENLILRLFDGKVEQEAPVFSRTMNKIIKGLPSAFKGMTNGEVMKAIFPDAECNFKKFCEEDTVIFNLNGFYMRVSADWCNSPYSEEGSN